LSGGSTCFTSSNFRTSGGLFGFAGRDTGVSIGTLTVKSNTGTTTFNTTELAENFSVGTTGFGSGTLSYDNAGNLTYDGNQAYTYDAWNRLVGVSHAYRNGSGTLSPGQTFVTMAYDG